jgi:hypothetical protein
VRAAAEVGAFGGTDASTTTDAPIATGAPTVTAPTMTAAGGNADDATMDLDPQASSGAAASTKDADRGGDEHGRKKRRMSDGDDGHSFAAAEAPAAPASTSDSERGHSEHAQKWRRISAGEGGPDERSVAAAPVMPPAPRAPLHGDPYPRVGSEGATSQAASAAAANAVQGTKKLSVAEKLMVCCAHDPPLHCVK